MSSFKQFKTEEIGLLLLGLDTVFVSNEETLRQKLLKQLESELSARGLRLANHSKKPLSKKPLYGSFLK